MAYEVNFVDEKGEVIPQVLLLNTAGDVMRYDSNGEGYVMADAGSYLVKSIGYVDKIIDVDADVTQMLASQYEGWHDVNIVGIRDWKPWILALWVCLAIYAIYKAKGK